jgi:splicing factor 3B subunit 3
VGSDSGRIVILEYDPRVNNFVKLHQETFGKSGARRVVPGQFLATDPKGRSCMIAAVEKAKLVYVLNRDANANLTISSPLEAHKSNAIIHHIVGLDVGFENPTFAALEVDYTEADQDPTGKAFNKTEKVSPAWLDNLWTMFDDDSDVDLLRVGFGSEPRSSKMERAY